MQRSLSSGVTGMVNHQLILDTVANNLANVSTPGFKSSRISFATALNQLSYAGSAPGNNTGGRNPEQIGLGVTSGSIDVDMSQGSLQSTGRAFDLAVQGEGFFQVAKVDATGTLSNQFYTRVGNFSFDSANNLVDLSTGLKVMGKQTDANGVTLGQVLPVDITSDRSMDAVATQNITYQGNLSSKAGALQGPALQSIFPLLEVDASNKSATASENTVLSHLANFNVSTGLNRFSEPAAPANQTHIYVFGTKPDGQPYGGEFDIMPWQNSVADLMNSVNRVLTQGESFGQVVLSNGTLTASGIGTGNGFSLFIGERNPINGLATDFATVLAPGGLASLTGAGFSAPGNFPAAGAINPGADGVLTSTITFPAATTLASNMTASITVNGVTVATQTIPADTYAAGDSFTIANPPGVAAGDAVRIVFGGGAATVDVSSTLGGVSALTTNAAGINTATTTTWPATPATIAPADAGALDPVFAFPSAGGPFTLTQPMTITTKVNGSIASTFTLAPNTYANGYTFHLPTYPNVASGDTVDFTFAGATVNGLRIATTTHGLTDTSGAVNYSGSGVAKVIGSHTISPSEPGLLQPRFVVPEGTYGGASGSIKIAIKVNGKEVAGIVPTGTLSTLAERTLSLSSYPHVKAGDVVTYELSNNKALANITWTTDMIADSNSANLTADLNSDGLPDLFQEGSSVDVNAWQYEKLNNATMNWYKMRFAPDVVSSSIQVYDKNGGSHILESRSFRTGTRSVVNSAATDRYNGWDMLLSIKPEDGVLTDDLVTGMQFDEKGRFLGSANLGSTIRGTALNDSNIYVGTPADDTMGVNWSTTGTASIKLDMGNANSTTGLTGFGTASTAASINQDGNANGELQSLSVSQNGNIVGLYSNGKSRPIYQLQVAVFSNPMGLTSAGTNLWQTSANSGDPIIREPGTAGSGTITAGALEGSNVDIASEFTRMITAQRGFQVNARVIQTTDSMLQELATLVR